MSLLSNFRCAGWWGWASDWWQSDQLRQRSRKPAWCWLAEKIVSYIFHISKYLTQGEKSAISQISCLTEFRQTTQQLMLSSPPGAVWESDSRGWLSSCHYEGSGHLWGPWQTRPTGWPLNSKRQLLSAAVPLCCRHGVSEVCRATQTAATRWALKAQCQIHKWLLHSMLTLYVDFISQ